MKLVSRLERNVMGRDWGMNYGHGPRMQFELGEFFMERTLREVLDILQIAVRLANNIRPSIDTYKPYLWT